VEFFNLLGDFVYSIHFFFHWETLDKTFVYEYNNIGNVTCVKEYDYFVTEEELPGCYKSIVYEYDAECPDKLTTFDGNVIEYNSAGCPSKYKDNHYEWANGKLSKVYCNKVSQESEYHMQYTLTHDGYGRRVRKHYISSCNYAPEYSEHTVDYTYDSSNRLIRELRTDVDYYGTKKTKELIYLYDESGMIGVMYNSQPYYYHRNLQGDVIAIYDANGEKQVEYAYDAWGNCTTIYQANSELASLNPIRYRGYYYDTETGLYYLNARYYSPEWRRFISPANATALNANTVNGLNLYNYADNNPIGIVHNSFCVDGSGSAGMISSIDFSDYRVGTTNPVISSKGGLNLGWIANGLNTGSTIHGLYTSISGLVNHTAYFAENLAPFADDMTMIGASLKEGVLAFNQFTWSLGESDAIGLLLGVGLDVYDSIQRGVSSGGVTLGAALTVAKSVGLIYLNKGIMYGATALGSSICPGVGTVVGFVVGGVACIVVDIFVGNWLADLIDKIAK
jgi:RHS repeat-associated protein